LNGLPSMSHFFGMVIFDRVKARISVATQKIQPRLVRDRIFFVGRDPVNEHILGRDLDRIEVPLTLILIEKTIYPKSLLFIPGITSKTSFLFLVYK
jgi:hypothetical protein